MTSKLIIVALVSLSTMLASGCMGLIRMAANPAAAAQVAGANMMQSTVGQVANVELASLFSRDETVSSIDTILSEHGENINDETRKSLQSLRNDVSENDNFLENDINSRQVISQRVKPDPFDERQQVAIRRRSKKGNKIGDPMIYGLPLSNNIRDPQVSQDAFHPKDDTVFLSVPPNNAYSDTTITAPLPIMRTDNEEGMPRLIRTPKDLRQVYKKQGHGGGKIEKRY